MKQFKIVEWRDDGIRRRGRIPAREEHCTGCPDGRGDRGDDADRSSRSDYLRASSTCRADHGHHRPKTSLASPAAKRERKMSSHCRRWRAGRAVELSSMAFTVLPSSQRWIEHISDDITSSISGYVKGEIIKSGTKGMREGKDPHLARHQKVISDLGYTRIPSAPTHGES